MSDLTIFMGMGKKWRVSAAEELLIQSIKKAFVTERMSVWRWWRRCWECFCRAVNSQPAEQGGQGCQGLTRTLSSCFPLLSLLARPPLFFHISHSFFIQFIGWLEPWAQAENWTLNTVPTLTYLFGTNIPSPWKMDFLQIQWLNLWNVWIKKFLAFLPVLAVYDSSYDKYFFPQILKLKTVSYLNV